CNMGHRILAARSVCGKARGLLTSRAMRERSSRGSRAAAAAWVVAAGIVAAVAAAAAGGCSKKAEGADGGVGRVVALGVTAKPRVAGPPAAAAAVPWVMAASGAAAIVATNADPGAAPLFTGDGANVVFVRRDGAVVRVDAADPSPRPVALVGAAGGIVRDLAS